LLGISVRTSVHGRTSRRRQAAELERQ
jgi:hypothetical protein